MRFTGKIGNLKRGDKFLVFSSTGNRPHKDQAYLEGYIVTNVDVLDREIEAESFDIPLTGPEVPIYRSSGGKPAYIELAHKDEQTQRSA